MLKVKKYFIIISKVIPSRIFFIATDLLLREMKYLLIYLFFYFVFNAMIEIVSVKILLLAVRSEDLSISEDIIFDLDEIVQNFLLYVKSCFGNIYLCAWFIYNLFY